VSSDLREDLARRVDAIEAGYELMLAYAAQGLPSDTLAANGGQLREYLRRFDDALTGLADRYREYVTTQQGVAPEAFEGFLEVLAGDARAAQAGLRLVMAQGSISSQLVDNLNASIHVRALLTDIFLIDEALK
jgi:phytoene dehydrogenase-like protein